MGLLINGIVALASAIITVVVTIYLTSKNEKKKESDKTLFRIYMQLMEIYGLYFWVSAEEIHGNRENENNGRREERFKIQQLSWKIADELRKIDHLPVMEDIINLLFAEDRDKYPSATARYKDFSDVLDKLSKKLNPNYQRIVCQISKKNFLMQTNNFIESNPKKHIDNTPVFLL